MYVTVSKAIDMAIKALRDLPESNENEQAITRLKNLQDKNHYTKWTKDLVFNRLSKWARTHNRNPTITNLAESGMPKGSQIRRLFDMSPKAFLNTYYPQLKEDTINKKYTTKSKQEYVDLFIEEYERIKPKSSREYNNKRNPNYPTWCTIARYINVSTWLQLLECTGVDTSHLNKIETAHNFNVTYHSDLYDRLAECLGMK